MARIDFRVEPSFFHHHKTKCLRRACGEHGVFCLLQLWGHAAENVPDGNLASMTDNAIESAAGWDEPGDEPSKFVAQLRHEDSRYLDDKQLHDWQEHQPYLCGHKERSEKAKNAAAAKWGHTPNSNKKTRATRLSVAKKKGNHTKEEWEEMKSFFGGCVKCQGQSGLKNFDRDHIIPIYMGGSHRIDNIQPLCAKCNAAKGKDTTDYRLSWCSQNAREMPAKWLPIAGVKGKDAYKTPTPLPLPPPSPQPSPLPENPTVQKPTPTKPGHTLSDIGIMLKAIGYMVRRSPKMETDLVMNVGNLRKRLEDWIAESSGKTWVMFKIGCYYEQFFTKPTNGADPLEDIRLPMNYLYTLIFPDHEKGQQTGMESPSGVAFRDEYTVDYWARMFIPEMFK